MLVVANLTPSVMVRGRTRDVFLTFLQVYSGGTL
jgi:hypothetical protein